MIKLYIFILASIFTLFLSSARASDNLEDNLDSLNRRLEQQVNAEKQAKKKAISAAEEVYLTRKSLIVSAKQIQEGESKISSLEKRFKSLKGQEEEMLVSIRSKKIYISKLLAILQAMSLRPIEALIIQQGAPIDTLRSSLLLRDIIPLITRETTKLQKKLSDLAKVRENIRQQYIRIKEATNKLRTQRKTLSSLLHKKIQLQKNLEKVAQQSTQKTKKLTSEAKNLQDLILELERKKEEQKLTFSITEFDFASMKGKIPLPVRGSVVKKYGETLQSGILSKGIIIKARKQAQVTAPFDGTVVFSGPFRDYRDVLIIDHGDGYHTLLAGMENNYTTTGQELLAGEPIGTLPEQESTLYVEIRKKGKTINPISWFNR